ncbi:alpha/beta hydrolase [Herbiconiux daphne]|uniref:Alpha/beta hydrolase n=1 Tax=Herbiconiux daphne TaxID=2970914 RepID=A0ABT2GWE9_9MICO|nr:alpha/beta hydrolase [Herbiconiux daphne]MCS5732293.1 alpha/beta hydrolase [Herbiconiux daphne]
MPTNLPPIVLIHGLWMTPASWDGWAERFRARGHEVITPAWPGIGDRTPAQVRADPHALEGVGLLEVVDHYDRIIRALPEPPIIMGHSFGAIFTLMLLDRGLGVAGVAVEPGNTAGVLTLRGSTLRTGAAVLTNPFRKNSATPITPGRFHYAFGNDLSRAESDAEWEKNAIPSYNRLFFEGVLAIPQAKKGITRVDFLKPDRAPLLIIGGEIDHVAPLAVQKALLRRYSEGPAVVEYREFPGRSHRIVGQQGWEDVADVAVEWAAQHAQAVRDSRSGDPA